LSQVEQGEKKTIPPGISQREGTGRAADSSRDDSGRLEAFQIASGLTIEDLKADAERQEHRRNQKFKDQFELIFTILIWLLFIGFVILGAIWFVHLISTPAFKLVHWLSEEQIDKVEGILTSGIIAGLVADHFKRRLG
jgi:hypothetical protein